ncbi:hypothetical protein [Streptomyces aquilus]|uniref:hypothetical protein n=1 Tax=Streptomyces aquilus TaxID=2548456 RepID=UPI0036A7533A
MRKLLSAHRYGVRCYNTSGEMLASVDDWLEPLFHERLRISDGRMHLSSRPGLGITLGEQAGAWTQAVHEVGGRP